MARTPTEYALPSFVFRPNLFSCSPDEPGIQKGGILSSTRHTVGVTGFLWPLLNGLALCTPAAIGFAFLSWMGPSWLARILAANDCTVESFAYVCVVFYLYTGAAVLLLGIYSRCFLWIHKLTLCEGRLFLPDWFSFAHVFCGTHPRSSCSHISNMRLDRFCHELKCSLTISRTYVKRFET